jgi:hypothetical protein
MSGEGQPITDTALPTLARLQAERGRTFHLTSPAGETFAAELRYVREAQAMSRRYQCYAGQFALSHPFPQDVYTVRSGADEWALLLTPIGPDEDGSPLIEALFHIKRPTDPQSGVVDASSSRK